MPGSTCAGVRAGGIVVIRMVHSAIQELGEGSGVRDRVQGRSVMSRLVLLLRDSLLSPLPRLDSALRSRERKPRTLAIFKIAAASRRFGHLLL